MFVTRGHRKPIVCVLFTVIITFGTYEAKGDKQPDDYDVPLYSDNSSSYTAYHMKPYERYDQLKLIPESFFISYYNPEYQTLPNPIDTAFNYQIYQENMNKKKTFVKKNNIDVLQKCIEDASISEKSKNDPRYVYENSEHFWKTDEMYYESNIFKKELEIAKKYHGLWYTLDESEFNFIQVYYQLFKKDYENESEFINARVQLVLLIQDNTPNIQKKIVMTDIDKGGELSTLLNTRIYLKNEDYTNYFMRITILGGIPFAASVLYSIYNLPDLKNAKVKFSVPTDQLGNPII